MLNYINQYNISNGIFICFDKDLNVRKLTSNHSQEVRDKQYKSFPSTKFETWTKENFVIMSLFIMFTKKPPSYKSMIQAMYEVKEKDVKVFKSEILNYNQLMARDIEYLFNKFGGKMSVDEIFNEYQQKNIKFYTLWFYLIKAKADFDEMLESRIKGAIIRRMQSLMLYVTFKEENLAKIEILLKERLDI